jgi:CxxC motif-containing protein
MEKNLTCISCPMGCQLTVVMSGHEIKMISGNQCPIGSKYAHAELRNPVRMLTSTLKVKNGTLPVVPVKTQTPIPKDQLFPCLNALKDIELQAPIKIGDIIFQNICATGVNIIATRPVDEQIPV